MRDATATISLTTPGARDLQALTAMRFFAAAMIVIHHTAHLFPWGVEEGKLPLGQGVSFFFVLSGFILTHVYSHRSVPYRQFALSRFARIWPVHLVTLIAVYLLIDPAWAQYGGEGFFNPALVFVANMLLLHAVIPFEAYVYSWNGVSWTISTEAFFYAAFPLLLALSARQRLIALLGFAGVVVAYLLFIRLASIPITAGVHELSGRFLTYPSPLFRGFEFVLGMCTYTLWASWDRASRPAYVHSLVELGAILLAAAWFFFFVRYVMSSPPADLVTRLWRPAASCFTFAALILAFASGKGITGRILSLRLMVWLAEISFALYMTHVIVFKYLYLYSEDGGVAPFGPVTAFGLSLLVAALTHHLVERPARYLLLKLSANKARRVERDEQHP